MSQRGRKKRSQRPEDAFEPERGRKKRSQHETKRWEALSEEQCEKLLGDVMRLALFLDHKKHPIKRADITTKVLADYKGSNLTSQLITEAQKRFKTIFGFELVEVPRVQVEASDSNKGTGVYILKNAFPKEAKAILKGDNHQLASQTALLHTILVLIVLSGGVLEADLLFSSLKKLGLHEDKPDPILHDWKKLIDYFVKELYLHRHKVPGRVNTSGATVVEYRWGGRALLEVDKIQIMRYSGALQ